MVAIWCKGLHIRAGGPLTKANKVCSWHPKVGLAQGPLQIGDEIADVFDAHRQPHQAIFDA